jgi:hypothetical protein
MKRKIISLVLLLSLLPFMGLATAQDPLPVVIKARTPFDLPLTDGTMAKAKVLPSTAGQAYLIFVVKGEPIVWTIITGGEVPTPTPVPPTPPTPTPPTPPTPTPTPASKVYALFIYDAQKVSTYPKEQAGIVTGESIQAYIKSKGGDYRCLSDGQDVSKEPDSFKVWYARPRTSLPWCIISNGKDLYEGPWDPTADAMLERLKKYGG